MGINRRAVSDGGQAAMLVMAAVVLSVTLAFGVGALSLRAVSWSRAQSAADAAALAGARGGFTEAARAATLNGATLLEFSGRDPAGAHPPGGNWVTITVTVAIGGDTATARASNMPP